MKKRSWWLVTIQKQNSAGLGSKDKDRGDGKTLILCPLIERSRQKVETKGPIPLIEVMGSFLVRDGR